MEPSISRIAGSLLRAFPWTTRRIGSSATGTTQRFPGPGTQSRNAKDHHGNPSWETVSPQPHTATPPLLVPRHHPSSNRKEAYQRLQLEVLSSCAVPSTSTLSAPCSAPRPRPLTAHPIARASVRPRHMPPANCQSSASLTSRPRQVGAQWHHLPCAWLWKTRWRFPRSDCDPGTRARALATPGGELRRSARLAASRWGSFLTGKAS